VAFEGGGQFDTNRGGGLSTDYWTARASTNVFELSGFESHPLRHAILIYKVFLAFLIFSPSIGPSTVKARPVALLTRLPLCPGKDAAILAKLDAPLATWAADYRDCSSLSCSLRFRHDQGARRGNSGNPDPPDLASCFDHRWIDFVTQVSDTPNSLATAERAIRFL